MTNIFTQIGNSSSSSSNNEYYYGLWDELMVGYFNKGIDFKISSLSVKALVDFGYIETKPDVSEIGNVVEGITLTTDYAKRVADTRIKLNCTCPKHINMQKIGVIKIK